MTDDEMMSDIDKSDFEDDNGEDSHDDCKSDK